MDPSAELEAALHRFLTDAREAAVELSDPSVFVDHALGGLGLRAVNDAAADLALLNGYAVRPSHIEGSVIAGRRLNSVTVMATGLAHALSGPVTPSYDELVAELFAYLTGPPVDHVRIVGIDADVELSTPVPVVDGWELTVADHAWLASVLPLPTLNHFRPSQAWDPIMWDGLAFLRRPDPEAKPDVGSTIWFPTAYGGFRRSSHHDVPDLLDRFEKP